VDVQPGLADLDRGADDDRDQSPRRREDEDREQDGGEDGHVSARPPLQERAERDREERADTGEVPRPVDEVRHEEKRYGNA
jgi:hypothetical protein